jgi:hypothetical protein
MADYSPNWLVRAGYHIPHLTPQLTPSELTFHDINGHRDEYLQSVVVFPIIIVVIGALVVITPLIIWLLKYHEVFSCVCKPIPVVPPTSHEEVFFEYMVEASPVVVWLFFAFIIMAAIANCCVLISDAYFIGAVMRFGGSMNDLNDMFTEAMDIGVRLSDIGNDINATAHSSSCSRLHNVLDSKLDVFIYSSQQLVITVGDVPESIDNAKETFAYYAEVVYAVMYTYLTVISCIIAMLITTTCFKDGLYLTCLICLTDFVALTLTAVASVELVLVVSRI